MKRSQLFILTIILFSYTTSAQTVTIGATTITRGKLTVVDSSSLYPYNTFLVNGLPMKPFLRSAIGFGGTNYTAGAISTIGIDASTARMAFYTGYTTGNIFSLPERITIANNGFVGINNSNPLSELDLIGNMKISSNNSVEFGAGLTKEINAGKIGYGSITPGELDIVGAGTTSSNRKIKLWSEAGTDFTGAINIESGKLTHNNTGAASLLPYAYGTVNISGVILNGTGNFTVSKIATGIYDIYLANSESYTLSAHTALVTVVGIGPVAFAKISGGITNPAPMGVIVADAAGNLIDREFSFIIYKP